MVRRGLRMVLDTEDGLDRGRRGGRRRVGAPRDARAPPARRRPRPQHARRAHAPGDPAVPRGGARRRRRRAHDGDRSGVRPARARKRAPAATCSRRAPTTNSSTRSAPSPAGGTYLNPSLGGRLATEAQAEIAVGSVFAGHRIDGIAGRGGMGVVYLATDLTLDRRVALKLIAGSVASDDEFRARFERECRVAASIEHPHVVPVYHAGQRGRAAVRDDALHRGHRPARAARRGGPARARARGRAGGAGRRRARRGAPARARPPRRQARQHPHRQRPRRRSRLPHRLRRHQAARGGRRPDTDRHGGGHRRLHGAGAGARRRRSTAAPTSTRSAACCSGR